MSYRRRLKTEEEEIGNDWKDSQRNKLHKTRQDNLTTPLMFVERVKDSAVTFINIQRSAKLKINLTFNKQ